MIFSIQFIILKRLAWVNIASYVLMLILSTSRYSFDFQVDISSAILGKEYSLSFHIT